MATKSKTAKTPKKKTTARKPQKFEFASAGKHTLINENGTISKNLAALSQKAEARTVRRAAKFASLFSDGALGPIDTADSNNIGYYSYQFPVDAMEMPVSRAEELEFYRLAYTRDPIVARAIDLHTELPCSKMRLEKPKSSVESFSDFVFDWFQRLMNDTRLFNVVIQAVREYHIAGESFLFVEWPEKFKELEICPAAKEALEKGRGYMAGVAPMTEATNNDLVGQDREILPDFITQRQRKESKLLKRKVAKVSSELATAAIDFDPNESPSRVNREILRNRKKLAKLRKEHEAKLAKLREEHEAREGLLAVAHLASEIVAQAATKVASAQLGVKLAAPGDAPAPDAGAPAGDAPAPDAAGAEAPAGEMADAGMEPGLEGGDIGDMGGMGAAPPMGGGGGGIGGPSIPGEMAGAAENAVAVADDARRLRHINDLQRVIHLLEKKKELLEQLQDIAEQRKLEKEIFSHVVNEEFEGFEKIQILQPERIELDNPNGEGLQIHYKPSETEKVSYLNDGEVSSQVKNELESNGAITMNQNAYQGSYVIHFARKKSGYETHGRSTLQSCMRAIIYREKLRQVQTTLASRNMTPINLITAPGVSEMQVAELRAHADEAIADPDYTIVTNYEVFWNKIDSQGRLLGLADEWSHTNANLAIGLGFSPEILIGEGMYSGNRVALDLMSVTYTQFREELSDILENQIFKPIAILKGFYELDNYGRPRWIYPKVTFGQLALRDTGDLYDMLFNLYSKGSVPVEAIYDLLGLDSETVSRQLEDSLFTVRDSKFNELLSSIYASASQNIVQGTDVVKRLAKSMNLHHEQQDQDQLEGSGEGM